METPQADRLVLMNNPIRVTGTRDVYRGNLVQLREDFVVLPQGTPAVYERVEIKHGASTLAMEENGDVWLVKEWKYAVGRPSIEVVSGGIEVGEEPLAAARRELREEAGLTAREWTELGFVDPFTTMLVCPNHLFLARGLETVGRELEEAEAHMELLRVPMEEAVRMALTGEMTHATSCVLIMKAAALAGVIKY